MKFISFVRAPLMTSGGSELISEGNWGEGGCLFEGLKLRARATNISHQ